MPSHKPMLAKDFEANEGYVNYPCFVQPKLDGVRATTDGKKFWSRNGNIFPRINMQQLMVDHVQRGTIVDGELMIPGATFEETVSAVKHASSSDRRASRRLRFHVFDIITTEAFVSRLSETKSIVAHARFCGAEWLRVPTVKIRDRIALTEFSKKMLAKGHEGVMIRNAFGLYVPRRTTDLLKWKPLLDAEFPIIGVLQAKGKDAGTPIFVCGVGKKTFRVRPMGSMDQRRKMWADRRKLIGQPLTVEYQNLTKYGVPRFPRGKVLRNYE